MRFKNLLKITVNLLCGFLIAGCSPNQLYRVPPTVDNAKPKDIFVLMDGTSNNPEVPTNVFRLYEEINKYNDQQTIATYIEGVGNEESLVGSTLSDIFATGMEARILQGYKFLVKQYRPGDRIFISGFSRGAFTARSLAGLISYAGIVKPVDGDDETFLDWWPFNSGYVFGNKILERVKDEIDVKNSTEWATWKRGDQPLLKQVFESDVDKYGEVIAQQAEIEFLGVWDTVPGSQFKNYFELGDLVCKEQKDNSDTKQRYQLDSYPPIHHIAHAVSIDEKREAFRPLFLCSKRIDKESVHNEKLTVLDEVAFPGAHADVGGGYEDKNNQLPDISLNWMIDKLKEHYDLKSCIGCIGEGVPGGLGHLSVSDNIMHVFPWSCKDRHLPCNVKLHESNDEREVDGAVPWRYFTKKPSDNAIEQQQTSATVNKSCEPDDEENILCIKQSNITCDRLFSDEK
ncbi:phospholipase effector Tle1 domain-containing protein [Methylomonas rhizoryzae]|uniref:phospholipase effector Tle1 domain-containing protein n=1 Tax=Methylomonas rhizoryzae TaxID=2608981 RepID=UPI001231B916|nr:DUF2235 domain-containing protein [Methylomonas rhizoryzae]